MRSNHQEMWIKDTPASFQFIVKAYQGMTGHQRGEIPFDSKETMFRAFRDSIIPFSVANKLAMVLFQFPPMFFVRVEKIIVNIPIQQKEFIKLNSF